nr:HAMP domain-containing sensor histidine kinase [Auraticoccus cholistanensis]
MVRVSVEAQNLVTVLGDDTDPAGRSRSLSASEESVGGVQALVVAPDDAVVLGSAALASGSTPSSSAVQAARERGQTVVLEADGGRLLAAPFYTGAGTEVLQVTVPDERLHRGLLRAYLVLGLLGVTLVGLATLAFARLGGWFLAPVRELAVVSRALAGGDLDRRAVPGGPRELVDVAEGLNALAERIRELLAAERERAAEVAHRLRTPLTAVQLGVEGVGDEQERQRLSTLLANLAHEVDAVITTSRDPGSGSSRVVDAREVVAERVEFWTALAHEEGRQVQLTLPHTSVWVPLAERDLADVLDVLLDNVLSHTPEGTGLHVALSRAVAEDDLVRLTVADEGPGIPSPEVALERGVSGGGSTGLGLSIVHRVVVGAGGEVEVGSRPGGGAMIRLRLPPARPEV